MFIGYNVTLNNVYIFWPEKAVIYLGIPNVKRPRDSLSASVVRLPFLNVLCEALFRLSGIVVANSFSKLLIR